MGQTNRRLSIIFLILFFVILYKKEKQIERIFAKNLARNHEKNNTWNIRPLVDDSFVPSSKQLGVLYCKLMDFKSDAVFEFRILIVKLIMTQNEKKYTSS